MILIVTPFGAESGSGNWRTASRYAELLDRAGFATRVVVGDDLRPELQHAEAAIVLHARRSQRAARDLRAAGIPYAVVLTGTDLYGDLQGLEDQPETQSTSEALQDAQARRAACLETLVGAQAVIGLQSDACPRLHSLWPKANQIPCPPCFSIPQTVSSGLAATPSPAYGGASEGPLQILMVGHLRAEKDPITGLDAFSMAFPQTGTAVLHHVGGCREAAVCSAFEARASALQEKHQLSVVLHGPLPREAVWERFGTAHLFFHPSLVEGGSLVLSEAAAAGCPVLASRIPAHEAMLGPDYPGFFEPGHPADAAAQLQAFSTQASTRAAWREALLQRQMVLCNETAETTALLAVLRQIRPDGRGGRQASTVG